MDSMIFCFFALESGFNSFLPPKSQLQWPMSTCMRGHCEAILFKYTVSSVSWKLNVYHWYISFGHALLKLCFSLLWLQKQKVKSDIQWNCVFECDCRSSLSHHLPFLLQDDGLPGSLPQAQGLVMGWRHNVVAVGADAQTPNLPMVALYSSEDS